MRSCVLSRSSRGLGHRPFKAATRVRIPFGIPLPQPRWLWFSCIDGDGTAPACHGHASRACCRAPSTSRHGAMTVASPIQWPCGSPRHLTMFVPSLLFGPEMRRYRKFASGELRGRHETRSRRAKCLVRATFYQHVPSISLLRLPIAKLFELLESSGRNSSKSSWTSER